MSKLRGAVALAVFCVLVVPSVLFYRLRVGLFHRLAFVGHAVLRRLPCDLAHEWGIPLIGWTAWGLLWEPWCWAWVRRQGVAQ